MNHYGNFTEVFSEVRSLFVPSDRYSVVLFKYDRSCFFTFHGKFVLCHVKTYSSFVVTGPNVSF